MRARSLLRLAAFVSLSVATGCGSATQLAEVPREVHSERADEKPGAAADTERPPASAQLELTYLGNEGALIQLRELGDGVDDLTLLIDGLIDDGLREYPTPTPALRDAIARGLPPFDQIELVLVTHHHDDHFGVAAARAVLARDPGIPLITTQQALARLTAAGPAPKARGLWPPEASPAELEIAPGVVVRAFNMHHGRSREPAVENLGFLVRAGGRARLLHVGDTELSTAELRALPLAPGDAPVDLAMIPYWHLVDETWRNALLDVFAPREILAIHLPRAGLEPDFYAPAKTLEGLIERLRALPRTRPLTTVGATTRLAPSPLDRSSSKP